MPSRLLRADLIPIETVDLGNGDYVKVRKWLTGGDRDEINGLITKLDYEKQTGEVQTNLTNRATLKVAIVEWGGAGFCQEDHPQAEDGTYDVHSRITGYSNDVAEVEPLEGPHTCVSVPVTIETLTILPDGDLRRIVAKINQRNQRPVAPQKGVGAPFPEATPAGTS